MVGKEDNILKARGSNLRGKEESARQAQSVLPESELTREREGTGLVVWKKLSTGKKEGKCSEVRKHSTSDAFT